MSSTFTVEDVSRFYEEIGEPCDLGCDKKEIEFWVSFCKEMYPEKGICTVERWAIVECKCGEEEVVLMKERMGLKPFVLNANKVIWDSKSRWQAGHFCCSYFLVEIEKNCLFITKNTCYILVGEGHEKSISPPMLLAIMEGLSF